MKRAALSPYIALLSLFIANATLAQSVFVRGESDGQGIVRGRASRCFVVTPKHVVENATQLIVVIAGSGQRGTAQILQTYDADVAVLELQPGSGITCPDWTVHPNIASLASAGQASLRIREENGSESYVSVTVNNVGADFIEVMPQGGNQIQQRMSGSQLLLGGTLAGILTSVNLDAGGVGTVYRIDSVNRLIWNVINPYDAVAGMNAALDDLSGRWHFDGDTRATIEIRRTTGRRFLAVWKTYGGILHDRADVRTDADIDDVLFSVGNKIGNPTERRYQDGTPMGEWTQQYEATIYYYASSVSRSRCPDPILVPGATATITYIPRYPDFRLLRVGNIRNGTVRYDYDDRDCKLDWVGSSSDYEYELELGSIPE